MWAYNYYGYTDVLEHHGVPKMKWGVRRYQNNDGSLTPLGKIHYGYGNTKRALKTASDTGKKLLERQRNDNTHSGYMKYVRDEAKRQIKDTFGYTHDEHRMLRRHRKDYAEKKAEKDFLENGPGSAKERLDKYGYASYDTKDPAFNTRRENTYVHPVLGEMTEHIAKGQGKHLWDRFGLNPDDYVRKAPTAQELADKFNGYSIQNYASTKGEGMKIDRMLQGRAKERIREGLGDIKRIRNAVKNDPESIGNTRREYNKESVASLRDLLTTTAKVAKESYMNSNYQPNVGELYSGALSKKQERSKSRLHRFLEDSMDYINNEGLEYYGGRTKETFTDKPEASSNNYGFRTESERKKKLKKYLDQTSKYINGAGLYNYAF